MKKNMRDMLRGEDGLLEGGGSSDDEEDIPKDNGKDVSNKGNCMPCCNFT